MKKFELNGVIKEVPVGISWTIFFFGLFVPMFRGDSKWAIISVTILIISLFTFGIPGIILQIYLFFRYNKIYADDLMEKGYKELKPGNEQKTEEVLKEIK